MQPVKQEMAEPPATVDALPRANAGPRAFFAAWRPKFRAFRGDYKRIRDLERPVIQPLPPTSVLLACGPFLSGILYVLAFFPLMWLTAKANGLDPVGTLLLLDYPAQLDSSFFAPLFPMWSNPAARPVVFALATLYGVIGIVAAVLLLAGGLQRLVVTSNGLLFGFYITRYVCTEILHILPVSAVEGRLFFFKLSYIMLSFYLATALSSLLPRDDLSRGKFEFLLMGGQALFAGRVLAWGFGGSAAVYGGAIYLTCAFLAMVAVEVAFRAFFRTMRVLGGEEEWMQFLAESRERRVSVTSLIATTKDLWSKERPLILLTVGICTVFPFLVAALYHFVLEGR